ncbi:MAG: glycosyltransferase family 39 protein [Chloroflexi bacterium]|nr:glycosyltransferase family 39 protein [Chloroflexota bacterium]
MGRLRGALLAVLLVAAALRFSALQSAPPGFWYDEGLNGQFARAVLAGDWRVFYGDREGLFFYLLGGAITLLGDSIFALRWLPAAVGVLTVAATFALGRRLLGTGAGLVAAAGLATSFWHFAINRFGERVNLLPLAEVVTLFCLWRALYPAPDERGRGFAWLAGLAGGITLYTYLASRFFPVVLLGWLLWQLAYDRATLRKRWTVWVKVGGTAALVFLPLGVHYLRFPDDFILRPSQVWPYSGLSGRVLLAELAQQFGRTLGMFFLTGDLNWRHNLSGRPAFDLVTAGLLAVGLVGTLRHFRQPAQALLVLWLVVMLLPSTLAAENPHFLRAFGALPAAWLLVASGGLSLARLVTGSQRSWRVVAIAGGVWLLGVTASNALAYFGAWRTDPRAIAAFEGEVPAGAAALQQLPPERPVAVAAWIRPHPGITYLLQPPRRLLWFSGGDGLALPATPSATVALFGEAPVGEEIVRHLGGRLLEAAVPGPDGQPRFRLYELDQLPPPAPGPVFGGVIRLEGVEWDVPRDGRGLPVIQPGESARLTLRLRVLQSPGRPDLAFSLRLVELGRTLFQDDASPYDSAFWQPGEQIFVQFEIETAPTLAPGIRQVELGVYARDGGLLPAVSASGEPLGDRASLGLLKLVPPALPEDRGPPLATFAGGITLRAALVQPLPCLVRPCPATLRLVWEAAAPLERSWTVFVHLVGREGRILAQADGVPAGGLFPTTSWAPGERIVDERRVQPPSPLPDQPLRLFIGLYDPVTGERVPREGGGTSVGIPFPS